MNATTKLVLALAEEIRRLKDTITYLEGRVLKKQIAQEELLQRDPPGARPEPHPGEQPQRRWSQRRKLAGFILLLAAGAGAPGQDLSLFSLPPPVPRTNYAVVQARLGTNVSEFSNEVAFTNSPCWLTWSNSANPPGTSNQLLVGRSSGCYTRTNDVGLTNTVRWPPPSPPLVVSASLGREFYRATNPPGLMYFKIKPTTTSNMVTISYSTNLIQWITPFTLIGDTGTNREITMQTQNL